MCVQTCVGRTVNASLQLHAKLLLFTRHSLCCMLIRATTKAKLIVSANRRYWPRVTKTIIDGNNNVVISRYNMLISFTIYVHRVAATGSWGRPVGWTSFFWSIGKLFVMSACQSVCPSLHCLLNCWRSNMHTAQFSRRRRDDFWHAFLDDVTTSKRKLKCWSVYMSRELTLGRIKS